MVFTISSSNLDITPIVTKGCVWKQYFLSLMLSFPFFTQGVQTIALSTSAHAGHWTGSETVPWSSTALILGAIAAAPLYSFLIDKWGRRFGFYLVIMVQGVSCIPLLLSPNEATTITLHVLAGVASGGLFTVLPIYIREICACEIRAATVSLMTAMTSAGYMVKLAMTQETLLYVMAGLVMVQFLAVFLAVESPSYLVMKDQLELAKTNLGNLMCVDREHPMVLNEVRLLKEESGRARATGSLNIYRILRNALWRDAAKIGIVLYTVTILGGSVVFLDLEKTLVQLKTDVDPQKILVPVCLLAGGLLSVVFMRFLERKYFLTFAYSVMVLSMGTLAVYTQAELTVTESRWVPVASLATLVFSYGLAWGVPTVILVEILNVEIRSTIFAFVYTYSQLLKLAEIHSMSFLEEIVGVYTLFYIFACINLFGAVYTISKVPDIKCKTVRQVERQLKRIPILKL